jgi:menaquinone reductase, multiheme cytochrome c subunit
VFTRQFDRRIRIAAAAVSLSVLTGAAFGTYALWPANLERGYQPEQPIEFSHAIMAGKHEIDCLYCHSEAETGPHATLPTVETCMKCHREIQTRDARGELKAGIAQLNDYWTSAKPILWEKVHDLADFAYFDHSRHLAEGTGLDCVDCHGEVEKMDRVERVHSLKMRWCLDCHMQSPPEGSPPEQLTRAPIHCTTCHR